MRTCLWLASILAAGVSVSLAQSPQQGTPMGQPPGGTPRATNPMDRPNYPTGTNPDDQRMQNKMDEKRFVKDALMGGTPSINPESTSWPS